MTTWLGAFIKSEWPSTSSVVDAGAGIGTQTLGLATRGYRVTPATTPSRTFFPMTRSCSRWASATAVSIPVAACCSRSATTVPPARAANSIPTLYLVEEDSSGAPTARVFRTRHYAIPTSRLLELMQEAGFERVRRIDQGFYQPVLVGTRPGS